MIVGQEKMSNLSKSTFENDYLFDFTTMSDVNDWYEVSDTVRSVGKSKATLGTFFIYDLSIGSTETKYIKLNTKTQIIFYNIQLLYTHFHLQNKNFFGF